MTMTGAAHSPIGSPRHARFVRVTHWVSAAAVAALLLSGIEVLISHPRFYWGEIGNINTPALFSIPTPSSRSSVPTGYGFTLPDQNGWSRYLHFQSAWVVLFTGLVYVIAGWRSGHFRRNLVPTVADRSWSALRASITQHLRFRTEAFADPSSYNALQRISYLAVIFVVVPLLVWTGLAMSAGFSAVFPWGVDILGGRQSARTLHFFATVALVAFVLVHVVMVIVAGFRARVGAMITGTAEESR